MLSIFIMYSPDREKALEYTISCLKDMPLYDQCQKTLVVDGRSNIVLKDWWVVEVPREDDKFNWSYMWDAGVVTARFEKVLYLDSDRLLPPYYLEKVIPKIEDGMFLFTTMHFLMLEEMPLEECKAALRDNSLLATTGKLKFEPRFSEPVHGPGKNVMSGSTAFTKYTYNQLGGVDPWYRGHGAFADTDFHFTARVGGCKFFDLEVPELHFPHPKRHGQQALGEMKLRRLGLDNFIYYCFKWNLPIALAESVAHECNLKRPAKYVQAKIKELNEELG